MYKRQPFYLRAGKRLGRRVTEIAVVFKKSSDRLFGERENPQVGQNAIVIRVQPDEGMTIRFSAKVPGTQMEIDVYKRQHVHRPVPGRRACRTPRH